MISEVLLTEAQIRSEVSTLREAGEKIRSDRAQAKRLLKRIGADGWPQLVEALRVESNAKKKVKSRILRYGPLSKAATRCIPVREFVGGTLFRFAQGIWRESKGCFSLREIPCPRENCRTADFGT